MYIMRYSRTRSWSWQGCRGLTCQKCTIPDHTEVLQLVSVLAQEDEKGTYDSTSDTNATEVDHGQHHLFPRLGIPAPVHVEPEETAQADCPRLACKRRPGELRTLTTKPTAEQRANQTQKRVEHGHRLGNDPCNHPQDQPDKHPGPRGDKIRLVHAVSALKDAQINVLRRDVTENDTGDDNGRQGDAVGHFLQHRVGRAQGRGSHILSGVDVGDNGRDDVNDDIEDLQQTEGFGEIARVFQFSHDTEEGDVWNCWDWWLIQYKAVGEQWKGKPTECKYNVGDGRKGRDKIRLDKSLDRHASGVLNTQTNHANHDGSHDTRKG